MSKENPTLEELENETCRNFGGNNCVLHGCMYGCVLYQAMKKIKEQTGDQTPVKIPPKN